MTGLLDLKIMNKITLHLQQTFSPPIRCVYCFNDPSNVVLGKVGFLLTLFLCMVNTINSVSLNSPKSNSGPTALVIWIVTCICFQLLAILEYAWVIAAKLSDQQVQTLRSSTENIKGTQSKYKTCTKNIDHVMISAFPASFIVFAVLFWIWV